MVVDHPSPSHICDSPFTRRFKDAAAYVWNCTLSKWPAISNSLNLELHFIEMACNIQQPKFGTALYRNGLQYPTASREATHQYLEQEELIYCPLLFSKPVSTFEWRCCGLDGKKYHSHTSRYHMQKTQNTMILNHLVQFSQIHREIHTYRYRYIYIFILLFLFLLLLLLLLLLYIIIHVYIHTYTCHKSTIYQIYTCHKSTIYQIYIYTRYTIYTIHLLIPSNQWPFQVPIYWTYKWSWKSTHRYVPKMYY